MDESIKNPLKQERANIMSVIYRSFLNAESHKNDLAERYRQALIRMRSPHMNWPNRYGPKPTMDYLDALIKERDKASKDADRLRRAYNKAQDLWEETPHFLLMRKQQPTPVDTGTQSTDAGAVQAAGKPIKSKFHRGKDLVVKMALN